MMPGRRDVAALRKWVQDFKERAQAKGDARMMGGTWVYRFRPADDPDAEPLTVTIEQFKGEGGSGHPQPGTYEAACFDAEGVLIEENNGEYLGDIEKKDGDDAETNPLATLAGQMLALTKAQKQTLEMSTFAEARSDRRAAQAEAREAKVRAELETALGAQDKLRAELTAAKIAADAAKNEAELARAERDAMRTDYEELQRRGGELAEAAPAFVRRAYVKFCEHFGEDPVGLDQDGSEAALMMIGEYLIKTYTPDGKVMIALALHYHYGLDWMPLRVLFYDAFRIDFPNPPPIDWVPPEPKEEIPAQEEMH